MNAVSIPQPYAAALLAGQGPVEHPSWWTDHRGPLLIHAGKRGTGNAPLAEGLACNALLGVVDLVACVRKEHRGADPDEVGYYWVLANPRAFATPFPYNGKLGMFQVADQLVDAALAGVPPAVAGRCPRQPAGGHPARRPGQPKRVGKETA
jgi:hypothetical protein